MRENEEDLARTLERFTTVSMHLTEGFESHQAYLTLVRFSASPIGFPGTRRPGSYELELDAVAVGILNEP